jgi:uncharacterized membrane protein
MKLIPNAGQVARYSISQWCNYAAVSIIGGYQMLPEKMQQALSVEWVFGLAAAALVFGIFGRLIYQPVLHGGK